MITKEMIVADVFEKFPQTREVFKRFGFGALLNPILRKTFGRVTTLERGCAMHKVQLEEFLSDLNSAILTENKAELMEELARPCCDCCGTGSDETEKLRRTPIGLLVSEYPQVQSIFIKYFGEGCFSCPAFGREDVNFACSMHNTDPETFASECLELIKKG